MLNLQSTSLRIYDDVVYSCSLNYMTKEKLLENAHMKSNKSPVGTGLSWTMTQNQARPILKWANQDENWAQGGTGLICPS